MVVDVGHCENLGKNTGNVCQQRRHNMPPSQGMQYGRARQESLPFELESGAGVGSGVDSGEGVGDAGGSVTTSGAGPCDG